MASFTISIRMYQTDRYYDRSIGPEAVMPPSSRISIPTMTAMTAVFSRMTAVFSRMTATAVNEAVPGTVRSLKVLLYTGYVPVQVHICTAE